MTRVGTIAAAVGVVAGGWSIWEHFWGSCRYLTCPALRAAPTGAEGALVLGLAVILVVGSLATFLAPAALFYLLAACGLAIDAVEALNYPTIAIFSFYATLTLVTLSVLLSIIAATRRTSVSEQSHPMNLPVFG